jgi:hypothetical protein
MFFLKTFEKQIDFLKKILYIIILGWARPGQLGRYWPNEFGLFFWSDRPNHLDWANTSPT